MSGSERHRELLRRMRSGTSEALSAAADMAEGYRQQIATLEKAFEEMSKKYETSEKQVRDLHRENARLKHEVAETTALLMSLPSAQQSVFIKAR